MKSKLVAMAAAATCMLALAGCSAGVSQGEYDAVVKERDSALEQLGELQSEYDAYMLNCKL